MKRLQFFVYLGIALTALIGCGKAEPPQNQLLNDYFSALAATTHGQTTDADIDRLMAFYSADVVYEHPGVGIKIEGINAQRQGANALRPSYGGDITDSVVEIVDFIEGPDVAMARLNVRFIANREGALELVAREQWRVLETKDGKITRIIDYW